MVIDTGSGSDTRTWRFSRQPPWLNGINEVNDERAIYFDRIMKALVFMITIHFGKLASC